MCGIFGITGNVTKETINTIISVIRHRGPDDFGVFQDQYISLGMTRLAIIDLSPTGHQPMCNEDESIWIVYNGELYNFQEQRNILEQSGYSFKSTSDTEVVLHMYEHYGDNFLVHMRGMFALAIYDKRQGPGKEKLLLARDPFGIKPLLYTHSGSHFIFASEMKAILASGLVERKINPAVLAVLLIKGSIPQPLTAVLGVQMLLPAHRLIFESGNIRIDRYWEFGINRRTELLHAPYPELVAAVRTALEESVRLHMVSDVPVGAFLSGGIDSSLLVALMSRLSIHKVRTFSIGFGAEGADIDETDDAYRIAQHIRTDHTRVEISGKDVRDKISHIALSLDQPSVDGVNSYLVSQITSQHVKVAISGTGGDEFFAGYPWFIRMYLSAKDNLQNFALKYAHEYLIFNIENAVQTLSLDIRNCFNINDLFHYFAHLPDQLPDAPPLERVSVLCLRGYTQNQLLRDIDAVSMAHSLEVRVPFIDPKIADIALSLPIHAKLNPELSGINPYAATYREMGVKKILIDIGKSLLPENMDNQPKRGFGMPFGSWMKGPLKDILEDTLSSDTICKRGIFDEYAVNSLKHSFYKGDIGWPMPWLLMITELWCREVLDKNFSSCY
jgi:asparagine synthase (glutamine-hydrolysing)